jgi:crossover junction endodeoxyribonuclease RuvC
LDVLHLFLSSHHNLNGARSEPVLKAKSSEHLILGLDPGSRRTGFGVVAVQDGRWRHVDHGVIHLKESLSLAERLVTLQLKLQEIYSVFKFSATVVEKIFFGKNADSAFKLGHARGICLLVSGQHAVPVEEYAARYVKKSVTGSGAASKDHVQMVVFNLLRLPSSQKIVHDASDALALALAHAQVCEVKSQIRRAMENSL